MPWFDCANKRPISANMGGTLSPNLGLVLHHAVANGSLFTFFNSPSAQVSAHFWVAKSGAIEQYVDTSVRAWHGMSLNNRYVGVETEGCVSPPHAEPFTEAQIRGLAQIYNEGMRRHNWPNRLANADGESGFGFHRMAVNTACPCDIRLNKRPEVLALAAGEPISPIPTPEPPTTIEEDEMITPVLQLGGQVHQYQASVDTLWHWWSDNQGERWHWERLIGPSGAPVNAKAKTVQASTFDNWMYVSCEDSDQQVWICRQERGKGWDIRRPTS